MLNFNFAVFFLSTYQVWSSDLTPPCRIAVAMGLHARLGAGNCLLYLLDAEIIARMVIVVEFYY